MPNYRLVYFDLRGRAEPIRWILALIGQEYKDERLENYKEWPERKKVVQYGKLPILYVDEQPLSDSVAICRYLAQQNNLVSSDPWSNAIGEEVVGFVHDLVPTVGKMRLAKVAGNDAEVERLSKELKEVILPSTLKGVENRLKGKKWLCGDKMTWTDVFTVCYLSEFLVKEPAMFEHFPSIKSTVEGVMAVPQIEKWLKERPETIM